MITCFPAGLGEFRIRDLNDEINKLLREKRHWEDRIKELGGPDYGVSQKDIILVHTCLARFSKTLPQNCRPPLSSIFFVTPEKPTETLRFKEENDYKYKI